MNLVLLTLIYAIALIEVLTGFYSKRGRFAHLGILFLGVGSCLLAIMGPRWFPTQFAVVLTIDVMVMATAFLYPLASLFVRWVESVGKRGARHEHQ